MRRTWQAWWCLAGLGLFACAPSHRMVHQSSAYFEHCYAADENPALTDAQREACWSAWLAHYTRFQSTQHVDFALRRVEVLQMGMTLDTEGEAAPPEAEDPISTTSSLQTYATQDVPVAPGCATTCQQLRAECQGHCVEMSEPCIESCQAYERVCMGGCY